MAKILKAKIQGARTVHVIPQDHRWTVKRDGVPETAFFSTQEGALAKARSIAKLTAPGQVVVFTKDGRIARVEFHGLPKILKPASKSTLGTKNIERAVFRVIRDRPLHVEVP